MLTRDFYNTLTSSLEAQGYHFSTEQQEKLFGYLQMLFEWNKIHNLTGIKDPNLWISRHILDSLSILPFLTGKRILDVGTGAGLPGIPLAIACPQFDFVLLDSNQKKIHFVQQVIIHLQLNNALSLCQRVEKYKSENLFDCILSRAFGSLSDFIQSSQHLLAKKGRFFAMKGKSELTLREALPLGYTIKEIRPVKVFDLNEERCLVEIVKE